MTKTYHVVMVGQEDDKYGVRDYTLSAHNEDEGAGVVFAFFSKDRAEGFVARQTKDNPPNLYTEQWNGDVVGDGVELTIPPEFRRMLKNGEYGVYEAELEYELPWLVGIACDENGRIALDWEWDENGEVVRNGVYRLPVFDLWRMDFEGEATDATTDIEVEAH